MKIRMTDGRTLDLDDFCREYPDAVACMDGFCVGDSNVDTWRVGDLVWPTYDAWDAADGTESDGAIGRCV